MFAIGKAINSLRIATQKRGAADPSRNGREGKVFVWQLREEDEGLLEKSVPGDGGLRRKPWLLHSLDVKEMTFCGVDVAFSNNVVFRNCAQLI